MIKLEVIDDCLVNGVAHKKGDVVELENGSQALSHALASGRLRKPAEIKPPSLHDEGIHPLKNELEGVIVDEKGNVKRGQTPLPEAQAKKGK